MPSIRNDEHFKQEWETCKLKCNKKAAEEMETYSCQDDLTVKDDRGNDCFWYWGKENTCGYFDNKGPFCEGIYGKNAPECQGTFEAKKACCAYQSNDDVPSADFCCSIISNGRT